MLDTVSTPESKIIQDAARSDQSEPQSPQATVDQKVEIWGTFGYSPFERQVMFEVAFMRYLPLGY